MKRDKSFNACKKAASRHNSRTAFKLADSTLYHTARNEKWLDEICAHMGTPPNRVENRTIAECESEALKYESRNEFKRGNGAVYYYARARGWLDEICAHMTPRMRSRSLKECREIAALYAKRTQFAKKDGATYYYARSKGWLEEICSHMIDSFVKNRTKEECIALAAMYERPVDFLRDHGAAYKKAQTSGWLAEMFSHMDYSVQQRNIVYAWKVKNINMWKIGISNEFCVNQRILEVSKRHDLEVETILIKKTEECAIIEKKLLKLGIKPMDIKRETGFTEFRILTEDETNNLIIFFTETTHD